jgi:hypothetical protein
MDREHPAVNPKFADSYSELKGLDMEDAVDIYTMPVEFLATMGKLREDTAHLLHEYCRDLLLPTLGLMETKRSCEEEASVEEIPPPQVPAVVKREPHTAARGEVSVEEILPPQTRVKQEQKQKKMPRTKPRAARRVECQPIREEYIVDWLDRVHEEAEVPDVGSLDSFDDTEVNTEKSDEGKEDEGKEDEDEDDGSTATSRMATSHEV